MMVEEAAAAASTKTNIVQCCTPPPNCHRPLTPHAPLLLQSTQALLSQEQVNRIVALGYQTCNNTNSSAYAHRGPVYVTRAALHHHHGSMKNNNSNYNISSDRTTTTTTTSASASTKVDLEQPNHHKVCVFKDKLVLQWIEDALSQHFQFFIESWYRDNYCSCCQQTKQTTTITTNDSSSCRNGRQQQQGHRAYKINPRLRLLRYDARDKDNFIPHYDATTTMTMTTTTTSTGEENAQGQSNVIEEEEEWESKLTILVYLNTGGGCDFCGGDTLFLGQQLDGCGNARSNNNNSDNTTTTSKIIHRSNTNNQTTATACPIPTSAITPKRGHVCVFNHDLYHASQELQFNDTLVGPTNNIYHNNNKAADDINDNNVGVCVVGGSKLVLRSDVMFVKTNQKRQSKGDGHICCMEQGKNEPSDVESSETTSLLPCFSDVLMALVPRMVLVEDILLQLQKSYDDLSDDDDDPSNKSRRQKQKQHAQLVQILDQLDMRFMSVKSFLLPGRQTIMAILLEDRIVEEAVDDLYETFLTKCERALS
jgi:hypothetical protein